MKTLLACAVLWAACASWAAELTPGQKSARFYYDLGPEEIDVSGYPKEQQDNYLRFRKTCSQCHTLARPISAPITERKDWERYVRRMHLHTQVRPGTSITREDARAIVDFLTYDGASRKKNAEFLAKAEELKAQFKKIEMERARARVEEDRKKARSAPPYMGDKP